MMLRLARTELLKHDLAGFYLPHSDAHQNEYLAEQDNRMKFLSGFDGSNGEILFTKNEALLWTDARYWVQAKTQLGADWTLMKYKANVHKFKEWAVQHIPKNSSIGFDPYLVSAKAAKETMDFFGNAELNFRPTQNIVNGIWNDRPSSIHSNIFYHQNSVATSEKMQKVKEEAKYKFLITSALDEIAWFLNLRGSDIPYNPIFFSYLVLDLSSGKSHLFCNTRKLNNLQKYLVENKVEVHSYESLELFIKAIDSEVEVDERRLNYQVYSQIKNPVHRPSIITDLKAIKSPEEIKGFKECHKRDAVAICKYLSTLELEHSLDEYSGSKLLTSFRSEQADFQGLSFETISAVGANAAIIHYKPSEESSVPIDRSHIYLLDSGGQYLDGTVDTTRTMHFGEPSEWEKECYTRVLKGNLDLERLVWPAEAAVSGADIDVIARRKLWEKGLNYNHGTGHGVGFFLNVHEGPHGISKLRTTVLKPGMVVTNEPGYYEEGSFGIRIENMLYVSKESNGSYSFGNFTVVPYDKKLIDLKLLEDSDIQFINQYHAKVWEVLKPILEEKREFRVLEWLEKATSPLY